jgi:hypothetical protein
MPFGGGGQVGLDDREVGESLQDAPAAAGGALRDFDGPNSALGFVTGEPDGQVGGESQDHVLVAAEPTASRSPSLRSCCTCPG